MVSISVNYKSINYIKTRNNYKMYFKLNVSSKFIIFFPKIKKKTHIKRNRKSTTTQIII